MKKTINLINKHLNVDGKKNEESSKVETKNAESNDVTEQAKMVCIIIKIYAGTFIIQKCGDYNNAQSPGFESWSWFQRVIISFPQIQRGLSIC